jgi:hypothetical protein
MWKTFSNGGEVKSRRVSEKGDSVLLRGSLIVNICKHVDVCRV